MGKNKYCSPRFYPTRVRPVSPRRRGPTPLDSIREALCSAKVEPIACLGASAATLFFWATPPCVAGAQGFFFVEKKKVIGENAGSWRESVGNGAGGLHSRGGAPCRPAGAGNVRPWHLPIGVPSGRAHGRCGDASLAEKFMQFLTFFLLPVKSFF